MSDTPETERKPFRRTGAVLVLFTAEERETLRQAAKKDDRALSAWIRHVCLRHARNQDLGR